MAQLIGNEKNIILELILEIKTQWIPRFKYSYASHLKVIEWSHQPPLLNPAQEFCIY